MFVVAKASFILSIICCYIDLSSALCAISCMVSIIVTNRNLEMGLAIWNGLICSALVLMGVGNCLCPTEIYEQMRKNLSPEFYES